MQKIPSSLQPVSTGHLGPWASPPNGIAGAGAAAVGGGAEPGTGMDKAAAAAALDVHVGCSWSLTSTTWFQSISQRLFYKIIGLPYVSIKIKSTSTNHWPLQSESNGVKRHSAIREFVVITLSWELARVTSKWVIIRAFFADLSVWLLLISIMAARKHVFNLGGVATESQEMGFMFMAPTVSSHFTRKLTSPTLGNGK